MCWVNKCCIFVPLNFGLVVIGVINFLIAACLSIVSIVCYFNKEKMTVLTEEKPHFIAEALGLDLKMETMNMILSAVVLVCVFWMLFSVLLIKGVVQNEPSLILSYFSFGIILTILCQLASLLLLLNKCWWIPLFIFVASMINIHCLVAVHSVYELMQKGTDFRFQRQEQDEDPLAGYFDEAFEA
ncbi:uncharacterized protein LOC142976863 [Anticarsia gemmatalis]|uniref:uncharacterized protein LOC142976863 n=1 Tax=Anticarsia gemmatalis TaxID=129554 RepID=UPI003F773495